MKKNKNKKINIKSDVIKQKAMNQNKKMQIKKYSVRHR